MTITHTKTGDFTARFDAIFAVVIAVCADFCAAARQGGIVPPNPTPLAGRRRRRTH